MPRARAGGRREAPGDSKQLRGYWGLAAFPPAGRVTGSAPSWGQVPRQGCSGGLVRASQRACGFIVWAVETRALPNLPAACRSAPPQRRRGDFSKPLSVKRSR